MKRVIGSINPADRNVTIWGAGFSGLVLGYYLKTAGYKVTIHEKSDRIGGKIQTETINGAAVERAANALFLNADGLELIRELKLDPLPASRKLKRLLMINGKPRRPYQLSMLTKLPNLRLKPPLITEGLSVAEFLRPLLGQEGVDNFISPALGGIYAAPAEQLHFKSIFTDVGEKAQFDSYWDFIRTLQKVHKAKPKTDIQGSVSFEGGMRTLIQRLGEVLKQEIKLSSKVEFKLRGNNIICTDAAAAADLLKDVRPPMSAALSKIRYQRLSSITVHLKTEIKALTNAFGVLIPLTRSFHATGILNNRAIFPSNNPNTLSYTLISPKEMSDAEVLEDLKRLHAPIHQDDLEHLERAMWERGIPLYDLQRYLSIKKLHQLADSESELAIFGNFVAGISLREMISAAKAFAQKHS